VHTQALDAPVHEVRLDTARGGFDFGQFWHVWRMTQKQKTRRGGGFFAD
jgi:hypothetical protein